MASVFLAVADTLCMGGILGIGFLLGPALLCICGGGLISLCGLALIGIANLIGIPIEMPFEIGGGI
jgi:hypothetical protein